MKGTILAFALFAAACATPHPHDKSISLKDQLLDSKLGRFAHVHNKQTAEKRAAGNKTRPGLELPGLRLSCDELKNQTCPNIGRPVCGSNDVTYKSSCEFVKGRCDDNTLTIRYGGACSAERSAKLQKVTGRQDKLASRQDRVNQRILEREKTKQEANKKLQEERQRLEAMSCDELKAQGCPDSGHPVCGVDGKTYMNLCQLLLTKCSDDSLRFQHSGECGREKPRLNKD